MNFVFITGSSRQYCKPFIVDGKSIGQVPPYVFQELEEYKQVFCVNANSVELENSLKTPEERTKKIHLVMESLRDKGTVCSLKGWRNEVISQFVNFDVFMKNIIYKHAVVTY